MRESGSHRYEENMEGCCLRHIKSVTITNAKYVIYSTVEHTERGTINQKIVLRSQRLFLPVLTTSVRRLFLSSLVLYVSHFRSTPRSAQTDNAVGILHTVGNADLLQGSRFCSSDTLRLLNDHKVLRHLLNNRLRDK